MCNVGGEYYDGENWFDSIVRHREARTCAECDLPIPAGVRHRRLLYGNGEYDDGAYDWRRTFEHLECSRLAHFAAGVVCGSDEYATGELEEHLEYCLDAIRWAAVKDDEALADEFEPSGDSFYDYEIDLDDAREALAWSEAIAHRYDGIERDVGGEG